MNMLERFKHRFIPMIVMVLFLTQCTFLLIFTMYVLMVSTIQCGYINVQNIKQCIQSTLIFDSQLFEIYNIQDPFCFKPPRTCRIHNCDHIHCLHIFYNGALFVSSN